MQRLVVTGQRRWLRLVVFWSAGCAAAVSGGHTSAAELPLFRAGAAVTDITPDVNVSLNGAISKPGPVKGIHDPLHARSIVLDDGTTKLAIVVTDLTMIERSVCDQVKALIQQQSGIAAEHVLIAAVHTHAAPRVRHGRVGPRDDKYYEHLKQQIARSVMLAQQRLVPAEVGWGSFQAPEYLECRRLLCEPNSVGANPFGLSGERVKSVAGKGGKIIRPAGPVDPQLFVVAIRSRTGDPIAVLANYSVHYCGGYAAGQVSADYFGYFARRIESHLGSAKEGSHPVGIMTNGTSGNTGSIQRLDRRKFAPFEWMQVAGRDLADRSWQVVQKTDFRREINLFMAEKDLLLRIRRPDPQRVAWAQDVLAHPEKKQPHPWSRVFAEQCMLLSHYPPERPVKLQVLRIGDLAIAAVSCEVFAETGLAIKQQSPFSDTFTISLANGAEGYLPPPLQHQWGGYETWPATSSCLEVDAEPKIRQALGGLLKQADQHRRRVDARDDPAADAAGLQG